MPASSGQTARRTASRRILAERRAEISHSSSPGTEQGKREHVAQGVCVLTSAAKASKAGHPSTRCSPAQACGSLMQPVNAPSRHPPAA